MPTPSKRRLTRDYKAALRRFLSQGSTAAHGPARRLGTRALALRLDTLDLALLHERTLISQALLCDTAAERDRIIRRARAFFAEAIVPMEATHRAALESNINLSRLNKGLLQRTRDLSTSNRNLQREITRRHALESSLRASEQNSARLLKQSHILQAQLKNLSRQIISAQEEERKRISRELHDVIAQMLTGINVRLASLKVEAMTNSRGLGRKISGTQRMVERSVDIVHRFARELRPALLDDLGLVPALHSFMKRFTKETGVRVTLTAFAGLEELSNAKRTALYRVAQEALTNVSRHANARLVDVIIQRLPNIVRMKIKDDGRSFDVSGLQHAGKSKRMGILGMRERIEMVGGTFTLESAPGRGTLVQADIPFKRAPERKAPR